MYREFKTMEHKNKVQNRECRNVPMPNVGDILYSTPLPKCFGHPFLIPEKYVWDQQLSPTFDFLKLMEIETSLKISYCYPHKENVANF